MSKRKRMCSENDNSSSGHQTSASFIPSRAVDCYSKMLDDQQFCDVTFLVGPAEEEIKAHKLFLIARSEMFRAQFRGNWEHSDTITLPQFEPREFRSFLKFLYTDKDCSSVDWMSLLKIAHYFLVQPLVKICAQHGVAIARNNIHQTLEVFQTARLYDQRAMVEKIGEFMAKSFVQLSRMTAFEMKVDDDTLRYLLRLNHLRIKECDLFKTVLSIAKRRAQKICRDNSGDVSMTVATEMDKFLPLIRFPTMGATDFRRVVDASGLLPSDTVINLYRYFAATDAADKQAIASTWAFSQVERRPREFIKFNTFVSFWPEQTRKLSAPDLKLDDYVSFNISMSPAIIKSHDGAADKGIAVTGIRIQCPAVIQGGTEMTEDLSCRIDIQQGDQGIEQRSRINLSSSLQMTCSVKPHDWTEVSFEPPLVIPSGSTKDFRISAEINFGAGQGNMSRERGILLQYGRFGQLSDVVEVGLCCQKGAVSGVKGRRAESLFDECRLIRGIYIQAI